MDMETTPSGEHLAGVELGGELPPFLDSHLIFFESQSKLFKACEDIAQGNSIDIETITGIFKNYNRAFVDYVTELFNLEQDNEERVRLLEKEMLAENSSRVNKLNELSSPGGTDLTRLADIKKYKNGGLFKRLRKGFESCEWDPTSFLDDWEEDYTEASVSQFNYFLSGHQQVLYDQDEKADDDSLEEIAPTTKVEIAAADQSENLTDEHKPQRQKQIGKYALDVIKLAAGVAGGIVIASLATRKK